MSRNGIALVLLLFWAAVLIFVVALVWRRFAKWGRDEEDVAAELRRYDEKSAQDNEDSR